jgi:dCMP deaminase
VVQAAYHGLSVAGATIYTTHQPCLTCAKLIVNAGIRRIVYSGEYPDPLAAEMIRQAGVVLERIVLAPAPVAD